MRRKTPCIRLFGRKSAGCCYRTDSLTPSCAGPPNRRAALTAARRPTIHRRLARSAATSICCTRPPAPMMPRMTASAIAVTGLPLSGTNAADYVLANPRCRAVGRARPHHRYHGDLRGITGAPPAAWPTPRCCPAPILPTRAVMTKPMPPSACWQSPSRRRWAAIVGSYLIKAPVWPPPRRRCLTLPVGNTGHSDRRNATPGGHRQQQFSRINAPASPDCSASN
jgi:hypothetical protein